LLAYVYTKFYILQTSVVGSTTYVQFGTITGSGPGGPWQDI